MASRPQAKKKATPKTDGRERLHVRIAHAGLCSRRAAEQYSKDGRVQVNGAYVREMGVSVGPEDIVAVDGIVLNTAKKYTLALYKPKGVVTTLFDPLQRPTIVRFLPDYGVQLKPVGRLDMDTEGLLLVTNDGELAQRLAHPSFGIEKEYMATVEGVPEDKELEKLRKGIWIEGGKTSPAEVVMTYGDPAGRSASLKIVIHEGRKRQVRLMCEAIGHRVTALKRVRIGPLFLKGMRSGECKLLGRKEVDQLRKLVGLEPQEG